MQETNINAYKAELVKVDGEIDTLKNRKEVLESYINANIDEQTKVAEVVVNTEVDDTPIVEDSVKTTKKGKK